MSVIIIIKLWWSECELECRWLIIGRTVLWGWKKKDACHVQSGQSELDEGARSTGVSLARFQPGQIEMVQCLPVWPCCSDPWYQLVTLKGQLSCITKKNKTLYFHCWPALSSDIKIRVHMPAVVTCSSAASVQSSLSCSPHNIICTLYPQDNKTYPLKLLDRTLFRITWHTKSCHFKSML